MVSKLDEVFQFHQQALELRSFRQQLLASNIANADTPGYKARDIDFGSALQAAIEKNSDKQPSSGVFATAGASEGRSIKDQQVLYRTASQPSIDGNTVEMDAERAQFLDNSIRMEAGLTFINGQIKTLLSAIQG